MHYPEYYQLAWLGYFSLSVLLFFLWWWCVNPFNRVLKRGLLLFYAACAWTPIAIAEHDLWVPAVTVAVFGGFMEGTHILLSGLRPLMVTLTVALILVLTEALFIRAKRH